MNRLSLSKRKKPNGTNEDLDHVARTRRPGEVYSDDIICLSGITNPAHNCYINAILQCLFNHPSFPKLVKELSDSHPLRCDRHCRSSSKTKTNKLAYYVHSLLSAQTLITGQFCSAAAVTCMYKEYKYLHRKTSSISLFPILAALKSKENNRA